MRKDSLRAHNCRAHESDVSAAHHVQFAIRDDAQKASPRHTANTQTRDRRLLTRPSEQFPTPNHHNSTHDATIVGDDAIRFVPEPTPSPGDPDA